MKLRKKFFILSFTVFHFIFPAISRNEIVDGIAAIVDEEIITISELEQRSLPYIMYAEKNLKEEERKARIASVKKEVLDELVNEKLLLLQARSQGISAGEEELQQELEILKKRFKESGNFVELLDEQGLSEEKLKESIREKLLIRKLTSSRLREEVEVPSEAETKQFYENNKKNFIESEKVAFTRITIKVDSETKWIMAEKEINEIRERILEGKDLETLSKKYEAELGKSKGEEKIFFTRGELLPEFEKELSPLKVGQISNIIKTKEGFHILRLEGRKEQRQKTFSDVRREIENLIYQMRMEKALEDWVKDLRGKAYIKVLD